MPQITRTVHLDELLVPRELNKKRSKMKNTEMRTEKKSEFFFLQELRWRDRENDFFLGGGAFCS